MDLVGSASSLKSAMKFALRSVARSALEEWVGVLPALVLLPPGDRARGHLNHQQQNVPFNVHHQYQQYQQQQENVAAAAAVAAVSTKNSRKRTQVVNFPESSSFSD